ncbi:hypothetical protein [uncultured Thiodictyon sp.]|uniref:hypothetical protein n=1 Tax=uncultured Thiodictyon sp. TaxID=1846217 RepID=UPI0025D43E84|nr:hypothetical protein [uncultured Thiodictyon sp.]
MKADWIAADQVVLADDWRPDYQLSRAAWLGRHAGEWAPLGRLGGCLDGWRVSSNPAASGYDPRIECAPVYRLRHIEPMELRTQAEHWLPPLLAEEPFCVQPMDVILRRVGSVAAALVSELHRRHPVDANLGIIRGLAPDQALWTAYCLNQPHYRDYLETSGSITELVRVGLRHIAGMPIAPKPAGMNALAQDYFEALNRDSQSFEQLFRLRRELSDWLAERLPDTAAFMSGSLATRRWARFAPEDLSDQLNMAVAEQHQMVRTLQETGLAAPLGSLAQIAPREPREANPETCRALRISDLDQQFGIAPRLAGRPELAWRTQVRPLAQFDVLLSTFAADPKVAFVAEPVTECILPSEQLITLCFHRFQGAFALLMESALVRAQWVRLATGSVQRFVQPAAVDQLVLPVPDQGLAERWHASLVDLMAKRRAARHRMDALLAEVGRLYDAIHPAIEART